jgi:hypothetical protein
MDRISRAWCHIQKTLFPFLEEHLDPLTESEKKVVSVLEMVAIDTLLPSPTWNIGRPPKSRSALAKAFLVKMIYNCDTNSDLISLLRGSPNLRRICGWGASSQVPSEATFSRSFREFAEMGLPERAHRALIERMEGDRLVGHVSRDATDIPVREKAPAKASKPSVPQVPKKRGRPKKGEARPPKEPTRIQKQRTQTLPEMMEDLPTGCDWGVKEKGGTLYRWKGYKLHVDWADGEIPVSALLTSASVHDSQAAIPLATMSAERVESLYDLMDAAYDSKDIREHSLSLGHVPIIDPNSRSGEGRELDPAQRRRLDERSTAERGYSLLKEGYGARNIRVRGYVKVSAHLMFGLLALAAERLLNLAT